MPEPSRGELPVSGTEMFTPPGPFRGGRDRKLAALQHAKVTPDRLNVPYLGTLLKRTEDILAHREGGKRPRVH